MIDVPEGHTEFDNCVVRKDSDQAIYVELDSGELHWIPKSLVHDNSEVYEMGTDGVLIIPEWLAVKKEMV